MSWQALAWGRRQPVGNASEKGVLWVLTDMANEGRNHMAWPSIATIARECSMAESTVREAIKRLVQRGLVEIHGNKVRRRYRLMLENGVQAPDDSAGNRCYSAGNRRNSAGNRRLSSHDPIKNPSGAAAPAAGHGLGENKSQDGSQEQQPPLCAKRLAADWQPSPADIDWATTNRPTVDWREEAEKFRNYWRSKAGRDAAKTEWSPMWQNWIMNAAKRERRQGGHGGERNGMIAATLAPGADAEPWELRVKAYARRKFWHPNWGDKPGGEHCRAPAELLAKYGCTAAAGT